MGVDTMVYCLWGMLFMELASRDVLCCARWYHCVMATRCCGIGGGFAVNFSCAWCMLGAAVNVGSVEEGGEFGPARVGNPPAPHGCGKRDCRWAA